MSPPIGAVLTDERVTQQETQQANEVKELLLETQTANFAHAQTYTTVVIFGGYAGMFALWSFTRDSLSAGANIWVGLLIGISMFTFVLFEIFGMLIRSKQHFKVRKLVLAELTPKEFLAKHKILVNESNLSIQRTVIPVWIAALIISISTGAGGTIILLCSFAAAIFSGTT